MKQRIGIIGLGRMGITHFSIINSHPEIEVVAIAEPASLILNMIRKYFKHIKAYENYTDFFVNECPDAILVTTPPSLHHAIALKAAEKNIHVFCEKPFTLDKNHAIELAGIFEKKMLVNQVGYVNRFNEVFRTVKTYVQDGVIGDIIRFKSEMYSRTITKTEESKTWRDSHENGGGALFEIGSHAIDLVNYIIGKPDRITGSSLTRIHSKRVEDAVIATFLYRNNISGTLNVNWSEESFRKPVNKLEIFGEKGKIIADQHGFKLFLNRARPEINFQSGWNSFSITDVFKPVPFYVRGNEFTAQLYHFIDCILHSNISNICTFRDAAHTQDIIDKIFTDYNLNGTFQS